MAKLDNDTYDVIIIGAGIGGLVCGCCLAKAGMKVLIAEQHYKAGGYCTSFTRQGFIFDAAAHSFGGYRHGSLGKIFRFLELDKKIKINKYDPADIVITPDHQITIWSDIDKTIDNLQTAFPNERSNITKFINFLIRPDPASFVRIRSWTFKKLLDQYFSDNKLKAILSFPLYGNGGLSPSLMSAYIGAKIFTDSILDGGYFPESSMQALPDALADRFREFGGELRLSCTVKKIKNSNKKVDGVILEKNVFIPAAYVVSNGDARQTFIKLLGIGPDNQDFLDIIRRMIPSLSMFIVYLGLDEKFNKWPQQQRTNVWYLSNYDIDSTYLSATKGRLIDIDNFIAHFIPDKKIIVTFLNAPFKNKKYWDSTREHLQESFIEKIERNISSSLSNHIIYKGTATPQTLFKYTSNYHGAAYGWESRLSQFADHKFRKSSIIQGLYMTGHWTTQGHGISGVTYLAWDTANILINKFK